MGDPNKTPAVEPFSQEAVEEGANREVLDQIFKAAGEARREGTPLCDNPYAPGSPERQEWSAGWCATLGPENENEEPNSGYVKN